MARKIGINELLLNELQEIKAEVKQVRQTDIPAINTQIATFGEKLKTVKHEQAWSTRIYTSIGIATAVVISMFTGRK